MRYLYWIVDFAVASILLLAVLILSFLSVDLLEETVTPTSIEVMEIRK